MLVSILNAAVIDINQNSNDLLPKSTLFVDKKDLHFNAIKKKDFLTHCPSKNINLGLLRDTTLWIKLKFYNSADKNISKVLQVRNPLLESVTLYTDASQNTKTLLDKKKSKELHTSFLLNLEPKKVKTYYLKVKNTTTTLRLGIALKDNMLYLQEQYHEKLVIFVFFTIIAMLMFYNLLLYLYSREKSYIFYTLYLFALLFQQSTYLGITQLYFPAWFVYYDNLGVVFKVNLLYITAILFARSFLQTQNYKLVDKIYKLFLILGIVEMPLFGTSWFYYPEVAIATALGFIFFNMFASIYIYKQGFTQARFFVLGWFFQLIGFTLMILDGLGFIAIMDRLPNIVMFFTSIEAILLSLAFVDRYIILKRAKELSDAKLFTELHNRQKIVEAEIKKATKQLEISLTNEKNLLKELHHRTKNNLQLILSLIRMQSDKLDEKTQIPCKDLENRINVIAQTQQMLYVNDDLQKIDMYEYISSLCYHLESLSLRTVSCYVDIEDLDMPIKEAGYLGLVVNELLTNSIKYVDKDEVEVRLRLTKEEDEYILVFEDNGRGIDVQNLTDDTLGLQLIKTLVQTQLEGELSMQNENGMQCTIRFRL
jgi:two-component sensor histidine kinase